MTVDPEGRTVATGRVENGKAYVDVHELPSFRRAASWRVGGLGIQWLRFGPDARSLFASVHKGGMRFDLNSHIGQIWEPGTGRPTSPLMRSTTLASYTPSADSLVTLTDDLWLVRDAASGRVRGSGFLPTLKLHLPHIPTVVPCFRRAETARSAFGRYQRMRSRFPAEEPKRRIR